MQSGDELYLFSVISMPQLKDKITMINDILSAHVLSGCGTASFLCGIGKGTLLKILKSENLVSISWVTHSHKRMMLCLNVQHLSHHVTNVQVNQT